jgi:hypothetical protein
MKVVVLGLLEWLLAALAVVLAIRLTGMAQFLRCLRLLVWWVGLAALLLLNFVVAPCGILGIQCQ